MKHAFLKFAVALTILCLQLPASAVTFEKAIDLYQMGNFEQAQLAFKDLALLGNTKAQMNISVMYIRGEYFEKDLAQAYAWAALAKDTGDSAASGLLALIEKTITATDKEKGATQFKELLKTYGSNAINMRSEPILPNQVTQVQPARRLYLKMPKYPHDMLRKGLSDIVDIEFTVDTDGSTRFFKVLSSTHAEASRAAINALRASRFEPEKMGTKSVTALGRNQRFIFRPGGEKLMAKELDAYLAEQKQKAQLGGSEEKFAYAFQLSGLKSGLSEIKGAENFNWDNPNTWFFKAAQDGSAIAKYKLGTSLLSGNLCNVDNGKGLFWLEQAVQDKISDAKLILAYEYLTGNRIKQDVTKGFALMEEASQANLDHANVLFAWLLSTYPDEKYRDFEKASELLKRIDENLYSDPRSFWEASFAVALGSGDWKQAEFMAKNLAKYNKEYDLKPTRTEALTQALNKKQPYVESL